MIIHYHKEVEEASSILIVAAAGMYPDRCRFGGEGFRYPMTRDHRP
jgi:hypothetical protein